MLLKYEDGTKKYVNDEEFFYYAHTPVAIPLKDKELVKLSEERDRMIREKRLEIDRMLENGEITLDQLYNGF